MVAEQFADMGLLAPQWWGLCPGLWGGCVRLHGREHPADESAGCPADQSDTPSRAADPGQFSGSSLVVRREHHAHARHHHVKAVVGKGKSLGVGLLPGQLYALLGGKRTTGFEQLGGKVRRDHLGSGPGCRYGRVARAGRHVEHAVTALQVEFGHQHLAES